MLPGREAKPCGEVSALAKHVRWRGQSGYGCSDQRADARDRHQAPGDSALPGTAADLRVQRLDLLIPGWRYSQDPQGSLRRCGQSRVLVRDKGNKATCIRRTLC